MRYHAYFATFGALLAIAACGEDETATGSSTTTSAQSTSTTNATSATTGSGQGGSQGGSAQGGSAEGGGGGIGATGCAENPQICPPDWECCTGVPYPPNGQCYPECTMKSDRSAKHDIAPVDADAVLEQLALVPLAQWRYDAAPEELHMGPMAQDFHGAFGLGGSDRHIATVDANGVTMAAVQALYRRFAAFQAASERESAALRAEVAALRAELERAAPMKR